MRDKNLKGHIVDIKRSIIGIRESCTGFIGNISKRSLPVDDYVMYRDKLVLRVSSGLRFGVEEIAIKIDKIDVFLKRCCLCLYTRISILTFEEKLCILKMISYTKLLQQSKKELIET